jgi:hypothetical protein
VRIAFKGDHCSAAHLSERKEKKRKKDPVAEIPDQSETQSKTSFEGRSGERPDNLENLVESELVAPNPEVKERRKKRKREREDDDKPPLGVGDTSEATGTRVDESGAKGKKKRKKNKPPTETPERTSSVIGTTLDAGVADLATRPLSKSKSESKKRGKEVAHEDADHSPRKRNKSKKSVHPDPSDDPDLTEQSRKGSHPHLHLSFFTQPSQRCRTYIPDPFLPEPGNSIKLAKIG